MEYKNKLDWNFIKENTREYTHIYHDYPARMIPQIPRKLLNMFHENENNLLYDPYCGSGSSLVEGLLAGLNVIGTDINPLAKLISEAKTDYSINPLHLENEINNFVDFTLGISNKNIEPVIIDKDNLSFWFKENAIKALSYIIGYINTVENISIKNFFKVAASETIRESSNTKKGEFKLNRYSNEKLQNHNPYAFKIMKEKLFRNLNGYKEFYREMVEKECHPVSRVYTLNTEHKIPEDMIKANSVDIVITSPPYGDSHTTVAYGQYTRFSSEWLGLWEHNIDKISMGGKILKDSISFKCASLDNAIEEIEKVKPKRALEVMSFYYDLKESIKNISGVIKQDGLSCYVVANRRVSGVLLPTNDAIKCFFEEYNFEYIDTFTRIIPNKRMPLKNSPSNIMGKTEETMNKEYIIVMRAL